MNLAARVIRKFQTEHARMTHGHPCRWAWESPCISFTFDDFPASAALIGAPIIEDIGARATFYMSSSLLGGESPSGTIASIAEAISLNARGHEIGCHTFSHMDCSLNTPDLVTADCIRNHVRFSEVGLPMPNSFAYPYGGINAAIRTSITSMYRSARTVWPGLNNSTFDLASLRSVPLIGRNLRARAAHYISKLRIDGGWLIFHSHDVNSKASKFGCSPDDLKYVCRLSVASGAHLLPVRDVVTRLSGETAV